MTVLTDQDQRLLDPLHSGDPALQPGDTPTVLEQPDEVPSPTRDPTPDPLPDPAQEA